MVQSAPSTFATFIRGGTSKALFFHEKDIPAPGPTRDEFLIRVMGSPDPNQIDGMGGSKIVTSKVAIIRPSKRPDADVDYTFAQVGLGEAEVNYSANCGNVSSGVGPFAINEGLLTSENWYEGKRVVKIYNTGMDAVLVAHVPVDEKTGRAMEKGDYKISGCPGSGAPILMDYSQTAKENTMLPTGSIIDKLDCTFGEVNATYCEVGNPITFVKAEALGIKGNEGVAEIDANTELLDRVREVRGRMAMKLGKCTEWSKVDQQAPMLPMVALVSAPTNPQAHVQSRLILDNHCHPSMAGTGGVCTTATSRMKGSIVHNILSADALRSEELIIQHPAGVLPISVKTEQTGPLPTFEVLGFCRHARYLFQGNLFIPANIVQEFSKPKQTTEGNTAIDQQTIGHPTSVPKDVVKHAKRADVTKELCAFVHGTKYSDLTSDAVQRLRQCFLDHIGVAELGAKVGESSPHFLEGIQASTAGFPSTNPVFGTDKRFLAQYAAFLNAAFAHTLDFDDTHTGGIIHVGVTIFATALAEAHAHPDLTLEQFLTASAIGYEVACRVSIALGASSWHRGFHNTSLAGVFGAVATLANFRKISLHETEMAFGLAVSFASGSMQYLANGSWNKRLHPAKAAHDSFLIVNLAQAGVLGAIQPIEGQYGLIAAHTDTPDAEVDIADLGKRWEFLNTGLKPYPACRVTHTSIELAALLSAKAKPNQKVENITIYMDPVPFPIVGVASPNKVHPDNVVDAQFSAFYQTAASWLYGDNQGWAIYDRIHDPDVQDLCGKITIESKQMENDLITTMVVTFEDGQTSEMTLQRPKWQQPERPPQDEEVAKKFKSLAVPVIGEEKANEIISFVTGKGNELVKELGSLVA